MKIESIIGRKNSKLISEALKRREMWEKIYDTSYIQRFFSFYDGELEALLELAKAVRKL